MLMITSVGLINPVAALLARDPIIAVAKPDEPPWPEAVVIRDSALAREGYAPSTRDLLAKRIIKTAQNGERDTTPLVDDGIAYLSELK
jgi:hypothetical protein